MTYHVALPYCMTHYLYLKFGIYLLNMTLMTYHVALPYRMIHHLCLKFGIYLITLALLLFYIEVLFTLLQKSVIARCPRYLWVYSDDIFLLSLKKRRGTKETL